jgi:hypothetical protein
MLLDSLFTYFSWFIESYMRLRNCVGIVETIEMDYSIYSKLDAFSMVNPIFNCCVYLGSLVFVAVGGTSQCCGVTLLVCRLWRYFELWWVLWGHFVGYVTYAAIMLSIFNCMSSMSSRTWKTLPDFFCGLLFFRGYGIYCGIPSY